MDAVQQANSGHPGHADGAWRRWPTACGSSFLRFDPQRPDLAQPRPLRALGGPRLDAALLAAAPDRRQGGQPEVRDARRAVGAARRHQAVPPARQQVPRPSRVPLDHAASRRRPARSARAWPPASAWRSPRSWLAAHFNRPGFEMFDFDVYALCGDGCMMEGISGEAASLAGHLKLANLCWIYDNNHITIEGNTALAFSEDVATRFLGYGWNVTRVGDANDLEHARRGPSTRSRTTTRPADADHRRQPHRLRRAEQAGHQRRPRRAAGRGGDPADQARSTAGRRTRSSSCPTACTSTSSEGIGKRGKELRDAWFDQLRGVPGEVSRAGRPALPDAAPPAARGLGQGPADLPRRRQGPGHAATRPGKVLNAIAKNVPWLIGGSADLAPVDQDAADVRRGRRLRGRRTTAAATSTSASASTRWAPILNGMALSKVRPYGSGFLIFSDYGRAADPAGRAHGDPGHLHLHARLDRRRRGRPDAPAGRAARRRCGRSPA